MTDKKIEITEKEMKALIKETVMDTLIQLGIEHKEPLEMQKDFQHLRDLRQSSDVIKRKGLISLVGVAITTFAALILMGLKDYFGV